MEAGLKEYYDLILAAWIHDIGKFFQRAGYRLDKPADEDAMTRFAPKIGTGPQAKYSHLHAIFSDKFIRENLPVVSVSGTLAALHHSPEQAGTDRMKYLASLIKLADWMSSGERRERESEEDREGYQSEPLVSIFTAIKIDKEVKKEKEETGPAYMPLVDLEETLEDLFPVRLKKEAFLAGDGRESYQKLWEQFIAEVSSLRNSDLQDIIKQIPFLLEKFTLTIPASTLDKPDLSLYHHSKNTAAIASCLYQLKLEEKTVEAIFGEIKQLPEKPYKEKEKANEMLMQLRLLNREDFILVAGDISGIQDFIYSVTSEKALKGLRGRSFYLQLISEVVALRILREFNLTEANLLFCGGGHFYALLPRIDGADEKLKALAEQMDLIFLQAHRGKLALILEWVPVKYADFFLDFASVWTEVGSKIDQSKRRKFASLFASADKEKYLERILGPYDIGGEKMVCEICGEELEDIGEKGGEGEERKVAEGEVEKFCSLCRSFISLTEDLNRAVAINIRPVGTENKSEISPARTWKGILAALGFECRFWKRRRGVEEKEPEYLKEYLLLNSTSFAGRFAGYKFIAQKTTGPDGETTLNLEQIAEASEGLKRWGVLRADVDRLGEIFGEGLGEDKTISRISMLSGLLSLYFNSRLNYLSKILKNNNQDISPIQPQTKNILDFIYIVYSGGDDLFLIGPWSLLPSLSISLAEDFNRFSSGRVTLSAGIYLAPSQKFPIYQAAGEAGKAEDTAKKAGRNRVTFLEKSLSWDKLKEIQEVAIKIRNLIEGRIGEEMEKPGIKDNLLQDRMEKKAKAVPRALLSILYDSYKEREMRLKGEISMERIWRLYYAFKRLKERIKEEKILKELQWLLGKSITLAPDKNKYEIFPELDIAVRWAEYLTRKGK